ncbi:beta strand repeat-containing protein [Luteolibacter soli]|uniref:Autotransporter-associated beta strand repeat-containing protein n=1 Tax=Luteolibacter soli TaxID=3135280 RepID=A0ABU9B0N5_9BACT
MKPTRTNPFLAGLVAPVVVALTLTVAHAANFTWDPGNTTNAATIDPGNGNWNTTAGNVVWNNAGTNVIWAAANTAVFGGADGTYAVTLDAALSTVNVNFNNSGYTISAAAPTILTATINNSTGGVATAANTGIWVAAGKTATLGNNVTVNLSATGFGSRVGLDNGAVLNVAAGAKIDKSAGANRDTVFAGVTGGTANINVAGTITRSVASDTAGIVIGNAGGEVIANVNSGGILSTTSTGATNTNGSISLGNVSGATGTLNIGSGATVTSSNANTTDAQSGVKIGTVSGGIGTVNLNGGTLTTLKVFKGAGTGTFNFNGGSLKPTVATTAFMTGLTAANVKAGGAIIDTNSFDLTIGQPLLHDSGLGSTADGGLTKNSAGILTLSGVNTYTGSTTLNAGSLVLADNAGLKFVVGNSTSNKLQGTGAVTLDGDFTIDISGVTSPNPSGYTLVSGVTPTYTTNFTVTGWTEVTPGEWRGSGWKFTTANSKLVSLDSDADGMEDSWELQIVNANPSDGITTIAQVLPGSDYDGDQATNLMEYTYGTSPTNPNEWPDTDFDGLNDGWEDATFGDHDGIIEPSDLTTATALDNDGDGLDDLWEDQYYGNNNGLVEPSDLTVQNDKNADPDGDHNTNAQEAVAHTNPNDNTSWPDTDFDGLNDGWEIFTFGNLTRATSSDNDGDYLSDAYEDTFFGNNNGTIEPSDLTPANAGGDPDGDGAFNYQESLSFTDPHNAADFPDLDGDGLGDGHYLRAGDVNSATTTSFIDGINWDNEAATVAGQKYVVAVSGLRTRDTVADFTFPGDRLLVATGGQLAWKNNGTLTISNLVLSGGLVNQAVTPNGTTVNLNGAISVRNTGSTLSGNNGPMIVNAPISGSGILNITGGNNVTLTATNSFTGRYAVTGKLVVGNGTTGSVNIKPVHGDTTTPIGIGGTGTVTLNGPFNIDTSLTGTTLNETWSILEPGTLTESYGANFTIPGFTADAGVAGSRLWTKTAGSVWYQFSESTGLFRVTDPDTDLDGMADSWEQQIINANPSDGITNINEVLPGSDYDGDQVTNLMEFTYGSNPVNPSSWPDTDFDGLNDGWEDMTFGDHDGIIEPSDLTTATAFDTDGDGWDDLTFEDATFGDNDGIVEPSDLVQAPFTDFDGDGASNKQELVVDSTDMKSSGSFIDNNGDGFADGARLTAGDGNGATTSFNGNVGHWSDGFGPLAGMNYYVAVDSFRTPDSTPANTTITFPGNRLVVATGGRVNFKSTGAHTVAFNKLMLDGGNLNQAGGNALITVAGNVTIRSASTYTGSNGPLTLSGPISGSGGLTASGGTLSFASNSTWTGNLTANGPFTLTDTGSMKFVPTTNGTTNSITGTGAVTLNGTLNIDLSGASTTIGHSWALVANSGTKTYGATFNVAGFTSSGGAAGTRSWSLGNYRFDEITGTLNVAQPGFGGWISGFGLAVADQDPTDDPDHDGISNLVEYAVDGLNPAAANGSVGSMSGLTVTFAKRALAVSNGDVSYAIEESSDVGGADAWSVIAPTVNSGSAISYTFPGPLVRDFVRLRVTQP